MRSNEHLNHQDTFPMLRRMLTWGSLYQMATLEAGAELLNVNLPDSKYHILAAVFAVGGAIVGLPYLLSLLMPKRYEQTLRNIDTVMRERYGIRRYKPPQMN